MAITFDTRDAPDAGRTGARMNAVANDRTRAFLVARRHSRLVRLLRVALPLAAAGILAAYALVSDRQLAVRRRPASGWRHSGHGRRSQHEGPDLFRREQGRRPLQGGGQARHRGVEPERADKADRCHGRAGSDQRRHEAQGQARPVRQSEERAGTLRRHRDRRHQRTVRPPLARHDLLQGQQDRVE